VKTLSIQIQTDLTSESDVRAALDALKPIANDVSLIRRVQETEATTENNYINVNFETSDAQRLWVVLQSVLHLNTEPKPTIASALIVVCEGSHGWNDYLLLHHYDKSQSVDEFVPSKKRQ